MIGPLALTAQDLMVRLGGRQILNAVSVAIRPGEVTAVVGPNGAGKSTLLSCLAGLRRADQGQVLLDDQPLYQWSARTRAQCLGYLPQTPDVAWRLDVETFVGLGRTAHQGLFGRSLEDGSAVTAALAATRMTDLADRDVTTLSGGERARALIARALAGQPRWLLADEPLTGLDPAHQLDAAQVLKAFARRGGGVVVTLHDLTFAARTADRILVLAGGVIISDGKAAQALSPEVLRRAYGLDAAWVDAPGGPLLDIQSHHD